MIDSVVDIVGLRGVVIPIVKVLAICCARLESQIIVRQFSHEDGIILHLRWPFSTLRGRENRNHTHRRYKSIYGEVFKLSGDLEELNLTGKVGELVPTILQFRAETPATYLGTREDLGEHRLG